MHEGDKIEIEKMEQLEIARRLQEELKNVDIDKILAEMEGKMNERARKLGKENISRQ